MTGINQLEMKFHEHADRIGKLNHEVKELKEQLEKTQSVLKNLYERLMVADLRPTRMKELPEWPFNVFVIAITSVLFLVGGLWIGFELHPYERCRQSYTSFEDISECVWILENN